jgi:LCP family protein required for cell wall assembly
LSTIRERKQRQASVWSWIGFFVLGIGCVIAFAAGTLTAGIRESKTLTALVTNVVFQKDPQEVFRGKDSLTLLILGCDSDMDNKRRIVRKYARSDMMMVAKLDFNAQKVSAISIPRDLVVQVPGFRPHKINAYHALGKDEDQSKLYAKMAAEHVLGVPIDRVVVLNFDAFKELVDIAGGVTLDVQKRMKYTDNWGGLFIDLHPGIQHLDGEAAMGFVRFRRTDSDFDRQMRQKQFLLSLKHSIITKPSAIPRIADKATDVLNGSLTAEEVAALVLYTRSVGPENIYMGMVPVIEHPGTTELSLNRSELRKTLEKLEFLPPSYARLRN